MKRQAFTLTELLVVIAILVVLAAILFPVFARVKGDGKLKSCQNRLRQFAVALNLYRADNDSKGFVWATYDGKGHRYPFNIFEPMGRISETGETVLQEIERWHKAMDLYRKQRWDEAEALLKALSQAAPETKLYKLFLKRIDHFRHNNPGPAWNGLWVFTTK